MKKTAILLVLLIGLMGLTLPVLAGDDRSANRSTSVDARVSEDQNTRIAVKARPTAGEDDRNTDDRQGKSISTLRDEVDLMTIIGLSGDAEVPADSGDPDGFGLAGVRIDVETGLLCYGVKVANVDEVVAGHIHVGGTDVDGPVVVDLMILEANMTTNDEGHVRFTQCLTDVDSEVLSAIVANPSGYYVNIHTTAFPDGAVRGQLA
jgi:hypothetical protein